MRLHATDLVRLVVDAIERTGRDAVHRRNFDTGLHETSSTPAVNCPRKLPPSKTSATLPAFFALSSAVISTSCDCVLAFFYPVLGWRARRFFEAAGEAESVSRSERGFRDALSVWTAVGKARPVLSADSGMTFRLRRLPEMNPIPSVDSGMQFPLELPLGKRVSV